VKVRVRNFQSLVFIGTAILFQSLVFIGTALLIAVLAVTTLYLIAKLFL